MAVLPITIREAPGGPNQDSVHTSTTFILSIALSVGFSFVIICGLCWRRKYRNRQLAAQRPPRRENVPLQNVPVPRRRVLGRNLLQSIPVIIWRAPRDSLEEGAADVSAHEDANGAKLSRASSEGDREGQPLERDSQAMVKDLNSAVTVVRKIPSDGETEAARHLSGSRLGIRSCSICTEDFVEGSTVRILPCMHVYHTRCIDPWLLDFAGTCPICRTDFQDLEPSPEEPIEAPPPAVLGSETAIALTPTPMSVSELIPEPVSSSDPVTGSEVEHGTTVLSVPAPVHVSAPAHTS